MTKKLMTVHEWVSEFSKTMALEFLKLIDSQEEDRGREVAQAVTAEFVAAFVAATAVRSLGSERFGSKTTQEQYESVSKSFAEHKTLMQDAVAAGFSGAMSQFTGKSVEYYCIIKPVPEPSSKTLN